MTRRQWRCVAWLTQIREEPPSNDHDDIEVASGNPELPRRLKPSRTLPSRDSVNIADSSSRSAVEPIEVSMGGDTD